MKKLAMAVLCLLGLFGQNLTAGGDRHNHTLPATITEFDGPSIWISVGMDAMNLIRAEFEKRQWLVHSEEDPFNDRVALMYVDENQLVFISQLMHINYGRCGGFMAHASYDAALEASEREVMLDANKLALTYTLDRATEVNSVLSSLDKANIVSTINSLSSYFNRYYTSTTAVNAANWLKGQWETMAAGRSDISVQLINHSWAMPSVMLTITGAHQPQDIVVIGGHLDSINSGNTAGVAPGADDDASGIATFTEALRAALANKYTPARTLRFIAYAAEEVGLRGSADIATTAVNNGDNVIGVLQLDMTNYKGSTNDIYLMTDYTNASQNTFINSLIDTYTGATRSTGSCGYACSDHASWHNRGFRASMPFESAMSQYNPNIHTANDTLAVSGYDAVHALKFSKLAVAYMIELAKGGINGNAGPDPGPVGGTTTTCSPVSWTRSNQSASKNTWIHNTLVVPTGCTGTLTANSSGGTGNANLYVRQGAQPTTSTYACRPFLSGNNESCTINNATAGTWYISLRAATTFSGVTLTANWQ